MEEQSAPRRRWMRWLLALLLSVIVIAAAAYFALNRFTALNPFAANDGSNGLAPTEHLIPVRLDSLLSEISINGSLAFSNKQDMTFGSAGFIDEILVSEGEIVSEGQPLARLDPESVSNLRRDIAQAQSDYEEALDNLQDAKQPTLRLAEAEAAVADAALELHNAQKTLDDLLNPEPNDIAAAQSAIADAALEAHTAQESLDELLAQPKPKAIADAEHAIAQARVAVQDAELALGSEYINALTDLEVADRELIVARLLLDAGSNDANVTEARKAFEQEQTDYANVIYKWTGVSATDEDMTIPPDDLFAALEFVPELVFDNDYPLFPDGRIADNPDTRWNELKIFAWRALFPGASQIDLDCEHDTLLPKPTTSDTTNTNAELCIRRDMDNAFEALRTARNTLHSELAAFDDSMASLNERHSRAITAQSEAQDKLNRLEGGSIDDLRLQAQLAKAKADLDAAKQDLDDLHKPNTAEIESKRKQLALALAKRDKADDDLQALITPEPAEVESNRKQIMLAQAKLDNANRDLQRIGDRRDLQVSLQEGALAAAQAKIDGATRRYDDSTLKAPWNGYIANIPVEAGKQIEPFEIILTVVNSGIVQVEGSVDEIDVLSLRRDDAATVTMDALPDQTLEGIVSSISSTATNQQGIVTFDVKITVSIPEDITLQEGLSAIAKVAVEEKRGLIIPIQTVRYGPDGAYVRMQDAAGEIVERPVTLGDSDGFYTIVEDGLAEGDRIAMQVLDDGQLDPNIIFEPDEDDGPPRGERRGPPPDRQGP